MKVYHQIQASALEMALVKGLLRTSRGDKGGDKVIIKTDHLLDMYRPQSLKKQGVSRDDNLYAYVRKDDTILDITDGKPVPLGVFIASSKQPILELDIDPHKCFISDLDAYDTLKSALTNHIDQPSLEQLAKAYWEKLIRLSDGTLSNIRRPEVMITYDIAPDKIRKM